MKTKKRTRFLSIILALLMIISIAPMGTFDFKTEALTNKEAVKSVLDSIAKEYPNGSYFSVDGEACNHGSGKKCYNCHLGHILDSKKITKAAKSKYNWDGNTCWGFASYCYTKCYGNSMYYKNYDVTSIKINNGEDKTSTKLVTVDELKAFITTYASVGDIIHYVHNDYKNDKKEWCSGGSHYLVYTGYSGSNMKLMDNNVGGNKYHTGTVRIGTVAFSTIRSKEKKVEIWHSKNYNTNRCVSPSIKVSNVSGGKSVTLVNNTSGSTVYYTLDGKEPTTSSAKYTSPITLTSTKTVKAISVKSGMTTSSIASKKVEATKTTTPKINAVLTADGYNMTITAESGATIYYTTNGSNPTTSSTKYTGALVLTSDATVKAIALKSGKLNSDVASSTVSAAVPAVPSVQLDSTSNAAIGLEDKINIKWNAINNSYEYIVTVKNGDTVVSEESTQGCVYSYIPTEAGTYTLTVKAVNFVGESESSSPAVSVTVKPDVTVTFKNYDGTVLSENTVHWNSSANVPTPPSRKGYSFKEWSGTYSNVKADSVVTAVYTPNTHTIKFVDENGTTLKAVTADYDSAVTPPTVPSKTGFDFVGWSVKSGEGDSYTQVNGDVTFEPIYAWSNPDMPIGVTAEKALRSSDAKSYYVTVKITNATDEIINGKLIAVIKTANDKVVATEINAITVPANASEAEYTATISSTNDAMLCEVYVVANDPDNADRTGGAYSEKATVKVTKETASSYSYWGEWSDWSTDHVAATDTKEVETKTQYRYRDKQNKTSTSSTLAGWTRSDTALNITYGPWSDWGTTKKTASATLDVESDEFYYYFHWCYGDGSGKTAPSDNYSYGVYGPHVLYKPLDKPLTFEKTSSTGYDIYSASKSDKCEKGSIYYYGGGIKTLYRSRSITTTYSFWKWGDYSEWSDTVYTDSSTREVETRILYRYRDLYTGTQTDSSDYVVTENLTGTTYNISGKLSNVSADYSGKTATVLVYKDRNTDPTENQIEYIGQIVLANNNSYDFSFIPKEEISVTTGNYIVSFGIATADGLINNIAYVEAPKPQYKVDFVDTIGNIISTQNIEKGRDAVAPELPAIEGYDVKWNRAFTNINSDTTVRAEATPKKYNVIFVDWANNEIVDIADVSYGSKVSFPADRSAVGKNFVGWSIDEDSVITEATVVEAVYEDIMFTVTFLNKDGSVFCTTHVPYGTAAALPEEEPVAENAEFISWNTDSSWWNVTEDITVKPIFSYSETVVDVECGEIEESYVEGSYFDLSTDTEDAKIYYTLDGTDPTEESMLLEDEQSICVFETCTIKAIAVKENANPSEISEFYIEVNGEDEVIMEEEEYIVLPEDPQLYVSSATAAAGGTVDITVSIVNNPGLIATSFKLDYDSSVMNLVDVKDSGLLGDGTFTAGNDLTAVPFTVLWEDALAPENYVEDGVLVTFTFAIDENAVGGEYPVSIIIDDGCTFDNEINDVGLAYVNGVVKISDRTPGDANEDGVINTKDIVLIKRFLADWSGVEINSANSDVNGDGLVNTKDVVVIKRYLAGWIGVELV